MLVSCLMPTRDRRSIAPLAIRSFLAQGYPDRELIVLDDGQDPIDDLLPVGDARVRYVRGNAMQPATTGVKLNYMVRELARGPLYAKWDDDDWHAPEFLGLVAPRLDPDAPGVAGLSSMLFYELGPRRAWQLKLPVNYVQDASMVFTRGYFDLGPFGEGRTGDGHKFIYEKPSSLRHVLPDPRLYIATRHAANKTSWDPGPPLWMPWGTPLDERFFAALG
jgi:hypothetical protein